MEQSPSWEADSPSASQEIKSFIKPEGPQPWHRNKVPNGQHTTTNNGLTKTPSMWRYLSSINDTEKNIYIKTSMILSNILYQLLLALKWAVTYEQSTNLKKTTSSSKHAVQNQYTLHYSVRSEIKQMKVTVFKHGDKTNNTPGC
jgi:hypothetical protein